MRGVSLAGSAKIGRDVLRSVCDVHVVDHAVEHSERGFGLVERDFMAGFVDAEEADCSEVSICLVGYSYHGMLVEHTVAVLPNLTELLSIDYELLVTGGSELFSMSVVDVERNSFSAEPVANVVGISVEQVHANSLVEQILEVLTEVGENEVSSVLELPVHYTISYVVRLRTSPSAHTSKCQSSQWCSSG